MKQLKLDAVASAVTDIPHGFEHIPGCFAGEAQDHMSDDGYSDTVKLLHGLIIYFCFVSAPDILYTLFVNGLQPQLDPYGLYPVKLRQKLKHIVGQAVGSCSYGQNDDIGVAYRLVIKLLKL